MRQRRRRRPVAAAAAVLAASSSTTTTTSFAAAQQQQQLPPPQQSFGGDERKKNSNSGSDAADSIVRTAASRGSKGEDSVLLPSSLPPLLSSSSSSSSRQRKARASAAGDSRRKGRSRRRTAETSSSSSSSSSAAAVEIANSVNLIEWDPVVVRRRSDGARADDSNDDEDKDEYYSDDDDDEVDGGEADAAALDLPHVGMVLTVGADDDEEDGDGSSNNIRNAYVLEEPVHLELGEDGRYVRYVADFAYQPVSGGDDYVAPVEDDGPRRRWEGTASEDEREFCHDEGGCEGGGLEEATNYWWQWWVPRFMWKSDADYYERFSSNYYRMNDKAFAGGSHGEVWRGRRRCKTHPQQQTRQQREDEESCRESLIFKRLKVEQGYRILEAGLREVHFGRWLSQQRLSDANRFTRYVDHFFRERSNGDLDLWIVFNDAGPTLRSYLYSGIVVGDTVILQQSAFWTKIRFGMHGSTQSASNDGDSDVAAYRSFGEAYQEKERDFRRSSPSESLSNMDAGEFIRSVLRQILEAAAFLHANGVVHR